MARLVRSDQPRDNESPRAVHDHVYRLNLADRNVIFAVLATGLWYAESEAARLRVAHCHTGSTNLSIVCRDS